MGSKNVFTAPLTWTAANPAPYREGIVQPVGTPTGAMAGTNIIYSEIIETQTFDNVGLELSWIGTPTGTIEIMGSNGGVNFYPLVFSPALSQPAGAAGAILVSLVDYAFRYLMVRYTNTMGAGTLAAVICAKDKN